MSIFIFLILLASAGADSRLGSVVRRNLRSLIQDNSNSGLPSGVTLVPPATLTSLYLNSPNISAARAYICQGDAYLVGLSVLNGFGNTNSAIKDPPTSISFIAGNCSDGTKLPDFSYDFSNPNWSTCARLNYSSGYTYLSRIYTLQDAANNLSSLAQRFTYRGNRILWQFNGQGSNNGSLSFGGCPQGQRFVGYAGLTTCDGPSLIQFACAAPGVSTGAFDPSQPIYIDTKFSLEYIQKALPPGVNSSFLPSAGPAASPGQATASTLEPI